MKRIVRLLYKAVSIDLECDDVSDRPSGLCICTDRFCKIRHIGSPPMLMILVTTSAMTATCGPTHVKDVCLAAYTLHHICISFVVGIVCTTFSSDRKLPKKSSQ